MVVLEIRTVLRRTRKVGVLGESAAVLEVVKEARQSRARRWPWSPFLVGLLLLALPDLLLPAPALDPAQLGPWAVEEEEEEGLAGGPPPLVQPSCRTPPN